MDKKQLHHLWTKLRVVKPWYFAVLAIVSGVICIFALRSNNEHMITLRDAVYTADKNNSNVEQALQNLRKYVYSHMNTDLAAGPNAVHPPIQLKYTYDRLVQIESQSIQSVNSNLYTDAQSYCQALIPTGFSGRYREGCINQYVTTHGASAQTVPKNLYEFDFVSPKWSPDLAGWSLIATVLLALAALVFWALEDLIRARLKRHK
jgi:preprotein translocase subunit SecF